MKHFGLATERSSSYAGACQFSASVELIASPHDRGSKARTVRNARAASE